MSCDCFEWWFDLTVAGKLCQDNPFWKQSKFICKQGKLEIFDKYNYCPSRRMLVVTDQSMK